ncbi:MAG TPA: type I secretion system permease/ATPase, partial [Rhodobacteraceae bacterium]|nr:type I secretion system permease/ATPase [Paracoccaceae bacterium]
LADLESIQRFYSSPVLFAIFDIFFSPLFLAAIFMFHMWLGWAATAGMVVLIIVTTLNQIMTKRVVSEANQASAQANAFSEDIRNHSELVRGLGMTNAALAKWQVVRNAALKKQISSSDRTGGFTAFSKSFRFFLQSAMLALGAYLTLLGEVTGGAMIASSIMLGRALAPIEQIIGQWPLVLRMKQGWRSLEALLSEVPDEADLTPLPKPKALLQLEQVSVVPPGTKSIVLQKLSFELKPGEVLGVLGLSASGKSSLARILTGIWQPVSGKVRLDGATLDQFGAEDLGKHIGYLPQDVTLFNATIAENISRLQADADPEMVIKAAKMAGAHELILKFPEGYNTRVTSKGGVLSGGQKQRVGLARAMFGDPVILVLDEPNSNLDAPGQHALNKAIQTMKANDNAVVMMVHRAPALAACDLVLVLEGGIARGFGPRDEMLKKFTKGNGQQLPPPKPEGRAP